MSSAAGAGIGVLGSAFNPPHLGHLALAQEALWQLGLGEVILVPTGEAPHKRIADDPGRELRMTMTRLAAADDSRFSVSALEVEREGPSYTYETLELLAEERGDNGAGVRDGRGRRRGPGELAQPRAGGRAGAAGGGAPGRRLRRRGRRRCCAASAPRAGRRCWRCPQFGVSSSAVRERAAAGRPLRYLVPEPVARFIEEKGIYS